MPAFPECKRPRARCWLPRPREQRSVPSGWSCSSAAEEHVLSCVWVSLTAQVSGVWRLRPPHWCAVQRSGDRDWMPSGYCLRSTRLCWPMRLEADGATINPQERFIFVKHPGGRVAVKRAEGTYPRIKQAVAKDKKLGDLEVKPLMDTLKLACSLSSSSEYPRIALEFSGDGSRGESSRRTWRRLTPWSRASSRTLQHELWTVRSWCGSCRTARSQRSRCSPRPYHGLFFQSGRGVPMALAGLEAEEMISRRAPLGAAYTQLNPGRAAAGLKENYEGTDLL
jgi:hypothetical protein